MAITVHILSSSRNSPNQPEFELDWRRKMNSPKTPTISKYGIATCLLLICGWAVPSAWATGFIASRHFGVGSYPYAVASGDFNGDGKADLAVANYLSNNVSVLI